MALRTALTAGVLGVAAVGGVAVAAILDVFGAPPTGDVSAHTGPLIGEDDAIDGLEQLPPALEGSLEGPNDTHIDPGLNIVAATPGTGVDIPTGARPSPLFGAQPFTQSMLLFEEFGRTNVAGAPAAPTPFPQPALGPAPQNDPTNINATGPLGTALDGFLAQPGISPPPTESANTTLTNPWRTRVEAFLGRALDTPPADGRPPGKGWAHQRWNEFLPKIFFKTAQAGARTNTGMRNAKQRHGYAVGEFGVNGLYRTVFKSENPNLPPLVGTTNGIAPRFHPSMPIQNHKGLWTFDGTFPPKLAVARYGEPILMRHYNALPIDPAANRGFGLHTITTHEHNGHNPAESDGFTNAFFFPGQYYDYRWPLQLAGHDTVNTTASDPRAAAPCTTGETLLVNDTTATATNRPCVNGRIQIRGDWRETMSTHWFHDHMLDFTAQNVYKGNAAMINFYSALDRGNEGVNDGVNLRLPSGTGLPWGNRDYDVNLVIADKAWDAAGQLWFNIFNKDGFLGDQVLTNFQYKPFFNVRARRYRFRILNGSVSRYFSFALVKKVNGTSGELAGPPGSNTSYNRVGFHLIANDGNIMEHAIPFDGTQDLDGAGPRTANSFKGQLPTQAIAERFDIVVNFAQAGIAAGDRLYLINTTEHATGAKPSGKIALASILNESYKPVATATGWSKDPGVGFVMELRVQTYAGTDLSMNPASFVPGQQKMIPLAIAANDPQLATATRREFEFGRSMGTDIAPWTVKTDGGQALTMDPRRVTAAPQLATGPTQPGFVGTNAQGNDVIGKMEVWTMKGNGGWSHPIHVHFEEGRILSRDGQPPPAWEFWARKDVYRIGPEDDASNELVIAMRFREFAGTYVEHCHNTQHEDHSMLMRWDLEFPGQIKLMPTPIPTWDGVEYVDSAALPTFRTGVGTGLP